VTSSPSTVGPPQAPRRKNGWLVLRRLGSGSATATRVCAHDRAGLGWSDPGPRPRAQQYADELHTLLTNVGIQGPYVLVTHSASGKTARLFASQYPNKVAGTAPIDARHESIDDHLTPDQVAAEDTQQRRSQDLIK
jgi:pimeloyl-ACP methyl ester carboxylesterase